ncbi:MAG: glycosyltransferase family 39 protein [Planctomycetes bacterium]|nr:glycosyltransferase family 39 protein [Planctomycetota bacterium]
MPSPTPFDRTATRHGWLAPTLAIAAAVLALRALLHGLLFPFELAGDEAHYWDWSRNLQLSYHTKGPAVAWLIHAGCRLLGVDEAGVRLGTWVCGAAGTVAAGWLGALVARGDRRVAVLAALVFQCVAAFQAAGSVMTIDMPMIAGWTLATAAAVSARQRALDGRPTGAVLTVLGGALAFAFLAKYTALLAALGLAIGLWPDRRALCAAPGGRLGLVAAAITFAIGPGIVLTWNAMHDWATVRHLLGHLSVSMDGASTKAWTGWSPLWTLEYVGIVLGAAGPFVAVAMIAGVRRSRRERLGAHRLCLWSALPLLVFYLAVSFRTKVEGNWAIGAYGPLVAPAAHWLVVSADADRHRWLRATILIRGAVTLTLILFAMPIVRGIEGLGRSFGRDWSSAAHRVSGHRRFALEVRDRVVEAIGPEGATAPIICNYYDRCGLLGFYLPDHPIVRCASKQLVGRGSAYDDFPGTRLPDPALIGRLVVLVGVDAATWRKAFELAEIRDLGIVMQRGRPRPLLVARLEAYSP